MYIDFATRHFVIDQSVCRGIEGMQRCTKWGILENADGVTVKQVLEFVKEGLQDLKGLPADWSRGSCRSVLLRRRNEKVVVMRDMEGWVAWRGVAGG